MTDRTLSSTLGQPRRRTVVLTTSNASLPIPSWVQGGKGIVYVTGCGGGASGRITITSGERGPGGGAGGFAVRHPMSIPAGVTTCAAVIGSGGAAVSAANNAFGVHGGETSLTIGSQVLRLEGGVGNGAGVTAGSRGWAYMGAQPPAGATLTAGSGPFGIIATSSGNSLGQIGAMPSTLGFGAFGGAGSTANGGRGAGGYSLFGAGGAALGAAPSLGANVPGAAATGYGAGGAGARYESGGAVSSGAGSPGLLILEFVEGV